MTDDLTKNEQAAEQPFYTRDIKQPPQPVEDTEQASGDAVAEPLVMTGSGFTDFCAGKPSVLHSFCLRYAESPTACTLCIDGCPVHALVVDTTPEREHIIANDDCLCCGTCVELCPVSAIATTRLTVQELNRNLLDTCLKTSQIILTCIRTEALARIADKQTDYEKKLARQEEAKKEAAEKEAAEAAAAELAAAELATAEAAAEQGDAVFPAEDACSITQGLSEADDETIGEVTDDLEEIEEEAEETEEAPVDELQLLKEELDELENDLNKLKADASLNYQFIDYEPMDYDVFETARRKNLLQTIPCLAMLGPEIWFSILNEVTAAEITKLDVLLPFGQCAQCPVNVTGKVDDIFDRAIGTAEQWSNLEVGILNNLDHLKLKPISVLTPLLEGTALNAEIDRREAFTGAFKGIKNVWDTAAAAAELAEKPKLTAAEEAAAKRRRLTAFQNTVLAQRMTQLKGAPTLLQSRDPVPLNSRPEGARIPPKRFIVIDALGRDATNASSVILKVSSTDEDLCIGCGKCVKTCSLMARRIAENKKASADSLICLGCGACIAACPKEACFYAAAYGREFVLRPPEPVEQPDAAKEPAVQEPAKA